MLIRLGMFDPPEGQPYLAINVSVVNSPAHQALALQAALEGVRTLISALLDLALTCVQTVLLKNQNNALPLSTSTIKTVAVIGPNGNVTTTMQGARYTNSLTSLTPSTANYYGIACNIVSPLEGIASFANVVSAPGCDISDPSVAGFGQACTVRASSHYLLLCVTSPLTRRVRRWLSKRTQWCWLWASIRPKSARAWTAPSYPSPAYRISSSQRLPRALAYVSNLSRYSWHMTHTTLRSDR